MIIVNLKGGTGNQLFQYALGRHLAYINNDVLKLDIGGLERANKTGDIYRPYALGHFNIDAAIATEAEAIKLKYPYGVISKAWRFFSFKLSQDKNTLFNSNILLRKGDNYLDGFWQSPLYFEEIRDVLLTDLKLKTPLSPAAAAFSEKIKITSAVSIHIRRGDYIKNSRVKEKFGPCSLSYYQRALTEIEKTVANPTYFVFSDDHNWVRDNLSFNDTAVFVQGEDLGDVIELMLMSQCQHNIIANSSFSWWGAWLNKNPDKLVIAPTPWFDHVPYDQNLIPPTWLKLNKY